MPVFGSTLLPAWRARVKAMREFDATFRSLGDDAASDGGRATPVDTELRRELWKTGRWMHAVVACGNGSRAQHIFSVYGHPGAEVQEKRVRKTVIRRRRRAEPRAEQPAAAAPAAPETAPEAPAPKAEASEAPKEVAAEAPGAPASEEVAEAPAADEVKPAQAEASKAEAKPAPRKPAAAAAAPPLLRHC